MLYVSWLILAILVGVYANGKGKSGFLYFIISIILSPLVGFLIAIISGDNENELIEQGKKTRCSNCGELVRSEAKICKFCNSKIENQITGIITEEDNERFKISFQIKDENSWNNLKTKLFAYYRKLNIENIISNKEMSWMLGGNEGVKGYIQATLKKDIVIIESFKLPKPDIEIINTEAKQQEDRKIIQESDSTDKLIELGKLLKNDLITKEEFEIEKKKILAR